MTDGVLTAAYDRIEVAATAVRRSARSQAQAAREEQAARRLQALLPVPGAAGLGAGGAAGPAPVMAPAAAGPAPEPDGITWGSAGSAGAATGGVPGVTAPSEAVPAVTAPSQAVPAATAPSQAVPGGPVPGGPLPAGLASPEVTAQLAADGGLSAVTRVEQCPHCRQPVTVMLVAAALPASGGPAG